MSNKSIKKKLFITMSTLGIIPFVAAIIFIGWQNARHWEANAKADCWSRNLTINQHLDQVMEKNFYVLRTLSYAPVVKNYLMNPDEQSKARIMEALSHTNKIFHDENPLAITEPSGRQLLRTDGAPKVNISQRRHFQEAMRGNEFVSDAIISMSTGDVMSVMVVPVFDDNHKAIGLVQRNILLNSMQGFLQTQDSPDTDIIIVDREDNVVAHTADNVLTPYIKGMNVSEGHKQVLQALGNSDGAVSLQLRGKDCLVTQSRSKTTGWSIITLTPYTTIWTSVNTIIFRGIMLGLFIFFFIALTAYFLSDRITRPIREITEVVTNLARGRNDIGHLSVLTDDELSEMANSINEMRNIHVDIKKTSQVDKLTGLHNIASAEAVCRRKLQAYQEAPTNIGLSALLLVDLDNFKKNNAEFGHQYGNQILREFAKQLTNIFEARDCIGRIEGDEFIIFLDHQPDQETIESKAAAVNQAAREMKVNGEPAGLSASIGIAIAPLNGNTYNQLFHAADLSLYAAQESGGNQYKLSEEQAEG